MNQLNPFPSSMWRLSSHSPGLYPGLGRLREMGGRKSILSSSELALVRFVCYVLTYGRGCGGPDGNHVVLEGNTTGLCDSSVLWAQVSGFYFREKVFPEMLIIYGFQIISSIWEHVTLVGVWGRQLGRGQSAKQKGVKITSHSTDLHSGPQIKPRHSSAWGQGWVLWACRPQSGCLSQRAKSKSIFIKLL